MRHRKRFERKLQKKLEAAGHLVVRVAGSGVAQTAHCDLVMFPQDINLPCLIEVKTTSQDEWVFKYQTKETKKEIHALKKQAEDYGVRGVVALKFMWRPWVFLDAEKMDEKFRVKRGKESNDFEFL